jgi:predicted ATPase
VRVTKFWARGYRSLKDVLLPDLGPFVILYGPNGSGKSNLIDALQTFFRLMPLAVDTAFGDDDVRRTFWDAGREAARWIRADEFFGRGATHEVVLGAVLEHLDPIPDEAPCDRRSAERVEVEITFWRPRDEQFNLKISRLVIDDEPLGLPFDDEAVRWFLPPATVFTHLGVIRTLAASGFDEKQLSWGTGFRLDGTIRDDEIVNELFLAKNSHERGDRERFARVQRFIETKIGHKIDVYVNQDKQLELREMLPDPNPLGVEIRADHAGHGLVQVYAILASILLGEGRLVALEEPEAHLHAPTMGRKLRGILHDMVVKDGLIDQLFIATHSNLFDLDETGYWDVALENGETIVHRKPLDEIDRAHLYEPGPAKHQLQEMLRLYGNDIVFHTADGRSLTASEMLVSLQNDDDVAQAFLKTMHAAALEATGLDAMRERADS